MNKTKKLELVFILIITSAVIAGVITIGNLTIAGVQKLTKFIKDPINQGYITPINIARATEPTMREWVLNEVQKAGLDSNYVEKLIQCESGWNNWAYGINTNGTTDFGLWQINSIHKKTISVESRWDYKIATKWAIDKRLRDGNWNAWVCSRKIK